MLVVEVVDETYLKVIHYTGGEALNPAAQASVGAKAVASSGICTIAEVREEIVEVDPSQDKVELLGYSAGVALYAGIRAIKRGREKIGEQCYNLFYNNCESFVNWCIADQNVTNQGEVAITTGGIIAGVAAIAGGIGAGIALAKYLTKRDTQSDEDDQLDQIEKHNDKHYV